MRCHPFIKNGAWELVFPKKHYIILKYRKQSETIGNKIFRMM